MIYLNTEFPTLSLKEYKLSHLMPYYYHEASNDIEYLKLVRNPLN